MVLIALKITFLRTKPKQVNYRDNKQFNWQDFKEELKESLTLA